MHQIERLSRESEYMKELAQKQEELISSLEKKVVDLEADSSEQQFVWESRELELERTVSRLESRNFSNKEV